MVQKRAIRAQGARRRRRSDQLPIEDISTKTGELFHMLIMANRRPEDRSSPSEPPLIFLVKNKFEASQ